MVNKPFGKRCNEKEKESAKQNHSKMIHSQMSLSSDTGFFLDRPMESSATTSIVMPHGAQQNEAAAATTQLTVAPTVAPPSSCTHLLKSLVSYS